MSLSNKAIDLIDAGLAGKSPAAVGRNFFRLLQPFGATAIFARSYWSMDMANETIFSRISPSGWEQIYDEQRFRENNMLTREIRHRAGAFAWSDIRTLDRNDIEFWNVLHECGFPDGLAVTCHGPDGYVGVTSLAFDRLQAIDPGDRLAIEIAGLVLHNRMRDMTPREDVIAPRLTRRERDSIGFVARGLSDNEIADRMGISATTVVSHIQNAKRKLGAKTRAQAVASSLLAGML